MESDEIHRILWNPMESYEIQRILEIHRILLNHRKCKKHHKSVCVCVCVCVVIECVL